MATSNDTPWEIRQPGKGSAPVNAFAGRATGWFSTLGGAIQEYADAEGRYLGEFNTVPANLCHERGNLPGPDPIQPKEVVVGPLELAVLHTEAAVPVYRHNWVAGPDSFGFWPKDWEHPEVVPLLDRPEIRQIWENLGVLEDYEKLLERSRWQDRNQADRREVASWPAPSLPCYDRDGREVELTWGAGRAPSQSHLRVETRYGPVTGIGCAWGGPEARLEDLREAALAAAKKWLDMDHFSYSSAPRAGLS